MFCQYKIFVKKEIKQFCRCKKIILLCILMSLYTPILNCVSAPENSILPFDFAIPLLVLWGCIYPSELTYSIMKEEYTFKSIEILYVSRIKPIIIILSKLTLPVLLSFIIAIVSIILNNIAVTLFGSGIAIDGLDPRYLFMLISTIIFDTSGFFFIMLIGGSNLHKNVFTAICLAVIFIISLLFAVYYYISFLLAALLLVIIIAILFYINVYLIRNSQQSLISQNKRNRNYLIFKKYPFLNICMESSCRFLNIKEIAILCISMIIFNLGIIALKINNPYISIPFFIIIANSLIFRSTLIETKYKSFKYYRLAHMNLFAIIFSRIAVPLLICFIIIIITSIIQDVVTIMVICNMILISLFICLLSLLTSLVIKQLKYEKQYTLVATLVLFSLTFVIMNWKNLTLTLLVFILYIVNMYVFYRRSYREL